MDFRYKFSIVLIVLGLISAIMSFGGKNSSSLPAEEILAVMLNGDYAISPDELAGMVVDQDSGIQIVDVRNPEQYKFESLPGALNLPLSGLLFPEYKSLFTDGSIKTVFYSDDELLSTRAWMLAMQKGYRNVYLLKGGLREWDSIVMKSEFSGETITARENALFEKRYKARRLFVQWNAMPDTLKAGFFAARQNKDRELVGGCE